MPCLRPCAAAMPKAPICWNPRSSPRSAREMPSWSKVRTAAAWDPSSSPCPNASARRAPPARRCEGDNVLYWLSQFSDVFTVLTGGAVLTALLFVFLFGPAIIDKLRASQGKGQPIRDDGPQSHLLTKKGTPTMGGLMILSGLVVSTLLWANLANAYVWVVLAVTLGFGAIGFADDYLKVKHGSAKGGLSGRMRIALEAVMAGTAVIVLTQLDSSSDSNALAMPFFKDLVINLGWFFIIVGAFVIVGAGNAVNLTDGLDGLAIVPVMIANATFSLIAYLAGNIVFSDYLQIRHIAGAGELAIVCGALIGAGLGFLRFNAPPASIFMGDTGSLALGGLLGAIAV